MPGTTTGGVPFPTGTDSVSAGPAKIQELAEWVDRYVARRAYGNSAGTTVTIASGSAVVPLADEAVPAAGFSVAGNAVVVADAGRYRFRASVVASGGGTDRDVVLTVEAGASGSLATVATQNARLVPVYGVAAAIEAEETVSAGHQFRVVLANATGAALNDVRAFRWTIERVV